MVFLLLWAKRGIPCILHLLRPQFQSFDLIAVVEDIVPGKNKFHTIFFYPLRHLFRTIARKSEKKVQNLDTLMYIHPSQSGYIKRLFFCMHIYLSQGVYIKCLFFCMHIYPFHGGYIQYLFFCMHIYLSQGGYFNSPPSKLGNRKSSHFRFSN